MDALRIRLYGHSGCPGTARARAYLLAAGIAFDDCDIADPPAAAEMRRWGGWATPLLVIGEDVCMTGFDQAEFEALLARFREVAAGGA